MYPNSPGFQSHSDTSREAAELVDAPGLRNHAFIYIQQQGIEGATIDEVATYLSGYLGRFIAPGTASARMIELERAGKVSKTPQRRKTRMGRKAVVYIAGSWTDQILGPPTVPDEALHRCETVSLFGAS